MLLDVLYVAFLIAIGVNWYGWRKATQERKQYEQAYQVVCRANQVVRETQAALDAKILEWDRLVLDAKLLSANQGTSRPEAFVAFGTFVEQQWKTLVFPTFKASTQHGYQTVLNVHVLPAWRDWRLRDMERLAIQQWVADKFRQRTGWQTVRNAGDSLARLLEQVDEPYRTW